MMAPMTTQTRYEIAKAGATPEFVELCKTLYGEAVDPDEIWDTVIKRGPRTAEQEAARRAKIRRNVERTSNAVGIGAGTLGLAAALKDPRLAHANAGPIARALHRTGKKMPAVADRIAERFPRLGATAATGAVTTQVANLGGDALIGGTLADEPAGGKKQPTSKRAGQLVPVSKVKIPAKVAGLKAKVPTMPQVLDIKAPKAKDVVDGIKAAQNPESLTNRAGRKAGQLLSTRTGRTVAITGAAVGAVGATRALTGGGSAPQPDPYYYGKSDSTDVTWQGTFSKLDNDKRLAFGWASVTHLNGSPVIDRQGDWIETEEIEKAAYDYVHKSRVGGDMHRRNGDAAHKVSDLVESIVFTDDKVEKMGLPDDFPRGWWVGFKIHDEDTWAEVKKGGRTGFSIHGKGLRKDVSTDEVMGYR